MDMNFEEKVRERAYHIWMSAGMGDGMAHEHWMTAEAAVREETPAPAVKVAKGAIKAATAKVPKVKSAKAKETKVKAPAKPRAKKATH